MREGKFPTLSELTIILVLRDREKFTSRWLDYYALTYPQINLIIADGSDKPLFTGSQNQELPKNIKYFYDGPDIDIQTMIRKIKKALSLVESEFMILSSNDDFYLLKGLADAVEFLKGNDDWHASAGIVRDFSVLNSAKLSDDTYGSVRFGDVLYKSTSISESTPLNRAIQFLLTDESFWHAVYRTQTLHTIYVEAEKMQINDLVIYELFINLKSAEIGKLHRNGNSLFMLHQVHSQMEAYKIKKQDERDKKWRDELNSLLERFFQSINTVGKAPTYEYIVKIRQQKAEEMVASSLRPAIERLKYKFAFSKIISIVNHLDPFTASIYRNQDVRRIIEFLKAPN